LSVIGCGPKKCPTVIGEDTRDALHDPQRICTCYITIGAITDAETKYQFAGIASKHISRKAPEVDFNWCQVVCRSEWSIVILRHQIINAGGDRLDNVVVWLALHQIGIHRCM